MPNKYHPQHTHETVDCHKLLHTIEQCNHEIDQLKKELALSRLAKENADKMLIEKSNDLMRMSQEFDSFTSSIIHGMRNNIQTVSGFCQTLVKFYFDNIDNEGKDFLTRIMAGTNKMKAILQSLSELSKITSKEIHREEVDLSSMARDICTKLKATEPDRSVTCIITPSGIAYTDKGLTKFLLEILLQNAWKFTRKNNAPSIEFGVSTEENIPTWFVKDNGMGFDPVHSNKLFQPFQHLHKEQQLQGMGIGLVIAKRILEKHGGTIWVRAEKEKGATFFFQFLKK